MSRLVLIATVLIFIKQVIAQETCISNTTRGYGAKNFTSLFTDLPILTSNEANDTWYSLAHVLLCEDSYKVSGIQATVD